MRCSEAPPSAMPTEAQVTSGNEAAPNAAPTDAPVVGGSGGSTERTAPTHRRGYARLGEQCHPRRERRQRCWRPRMRSPTSCGRGGGRARAISKRASVAERRTMFEVVLPKDVKDINL